MSIKNLPTEIQSLLNAAAKINNYKIAIEELVYNSLDADATSIAIRVHIHEHFIQVIDNGFGIPKRDLPLLGQRYASSKNADVSVFKSAQNKYGFRGESLSNVIEVSHSVTITTRYENNETWVKCFLNGKHRNSYSTTMRPSKGTTIEVKGFLYNLHIQEKATNALNELQDIKTFLQQLSLVSTNVSISFRDNSTNEIIFKIHKNRDVYQTLSSLFEIDKDNLQELQVEKNQYIAKGYIGKKDPDSNSYKWIYLNGRFIYKSALHDIVNANFTKSTSFCRNRKLKNFSNDVEMQIKEHENSLHYFIFISCPYFDYDISFTLKKTLLEFKDWNLIKQLMEKIVKFYRGDINLKQIEMKRPVELKTIHNTREEVRKIMEKILGNESKNVMISQMRKDVKGKITRKMFKNKMAHCNTVSKNSHRRSNKIMKTKQTPYKIFTKKKCQVLENSPIWNNIQVFESKRNLENKKENRKEISKNSKVRQKSNLKQHVDPLITKFNEDTHSVKDRCNLYSQNIKKTLHKKVKQNIKRRNNVIIGNDTFLEYECNNGIHNYRDYSVSSQNYNGIVPISTFNKEYLKSYDLVKTILNSQKYFNNYDRKYTMNLQNDSNEGFSFKDNYIKGNKTVTCVNNTESNILIIENNSSIPKLTFESHNYDKHNIVIMENNKLTQFVTEQSNDKFVLQNNITQSTNIASKSKHKNTISERSKSHLHLKANKANNIRNKFKILYSKSKKNIHHIKQSTHISEFMDTYDGIKNFKTDSKDSWNSMFQNNSKINKWNCDVSGNIQNTYTVIDTNVSLDIKNYFNTNKNSSNFQESSFSYHDIFNSLHNCNEQENNWQLFPKSGDGKEKDMKVLFISNSQNSETQEDSIITIEPLNVCASVYRNSDIDNFAITDNFNQQRDEEINDKDNHEHSKLWTVDTVNGSLSYINKEISHHFNNIDKNEDFHSGFCNSELIIDEQCNFNRNEVSNFKTQNKNDSHEYLDACIINKLDNVELCHQIGKDFNNFKLQNRHSFLPKGMSPIFENCQSKNICSYSLEVDYFQDDLYNNFANNVLVNITTFEKRIQNMKDKYKNVLQENNDNCLTFNTHSLQNAKVFGQVDKKFIVAELHSVTNNHLKYLVLFDQHAVHERVRLEKNMADYKNGNQWFSTNCEKLSLNVGKDNILYLNNFKDKFAQLGMDWTIQNDYQIAINAIPKAIFGKHCRQPDIILRSVKNLILEEIKAIKLFSGNTLLYPKSIMDLVFSEACRYAIKFGDKLSKRECEMLINSLSSCKTPFQCAHGRPVMAVLMDLKSFNNEYKVDMSKISMFTNKRMN